MCRQGRLWQGAHSHPYLYLGLRQLGVVPHQVRVVQHKQTRELYALKYINKAKCVKMKAVANIIQERRLLEEVRPVALSLLIQAVVLIYILPPADRSPFRRQHALRVPG